MIKKVIQKYREKNAYLYSIAKITDRETKVEHVTPSSNCHNSYSVAKLFTVTAIGMLYDEGKLHLEEYVYEILQEFFPEKFDPKWKEVTLHQLLSHKFGLAKVSEDVSYLDIDVDDVNQYPTDDYLQYAVSVDLPGELDDEYVYSDIPHYLLSRVVAKKTGQDVYDFLRKRLFNPLKFHEAAWSRCPHGYSIGSTGLYIRTEDMAKLGVVYLDNGYYEGKEIISSKWCDIVLEKGYELKERPENPQTWQKGGMYGQNLYISRPSQTVLAWHGFGYLGIENDVMDELKM